MEYYFAPMEGITGYIQRNAFQSCFSLIDKYFTAFIAPNQMGKFSSREKNDILPEHNQNLCLIPQVMTNQSDDFIKTAKSLKLLGYNEINLNLGCPSKTVVSKGRGSGFLAKKKELNEFLDQVFSNTDISVSIKTRIGRDEPEEIYEIMDIYNRYPLKELIVHPRTQCDFYKNKPNLEMFDYVLKNSCAPVCYNGDIVTVKDFKTFTGKFPEVKHVMIGRGLLRNPGLLHMVESGTAIAKEDIRRYHDMVYAGYQEVLFGEKTILFKMKELWFYMIHLFEDAKKYEKMIKKAERLYIYENAVDRIFAELEIQEELL